VETVRVVAPDGAQREVDGVTGARYRSNDGVYDMHPADAHAYRSIGATLPSLTGVATKRGGYRCTRCGFAAWFTTCGRCGGACTTSTED
jgi:hypothetical protein